MEKPKRSMQEGLLFGSGSCRTDSDKWKWEIQHSFRGSGGSRRRFGRGEYSLYLVFWLPDYTHREQKKSLSILNPKVLCGNELLIIVTKYLETEIHWHDMSLKLDVWRSPKMYHAYPEVTLQRRQEASYQVLCLLAHVPSQGAEQAQMRQNRHRQNRFQSLFSKCFIWSIRLC